MGSIRTVGIVGAGTMGLGIAQVCAASGYQTKLFDVSADQVERALRTIDKNLSFLVSKGKLNEAEKQNIQHHIEAVSTLKELTVDLVIEAAVEKLDIKQELFRQLESITAGTAILATNTSSIPVSRIGEALNDPSACVGLHFFNPADRMKLVEIISGESTREDVLKRVRDFAAAIGKSAVEAKDSPGFIVNRVARHFYVESLYLLQNRAAEIPAIDALIRSAGFRMGPFELMDLIGVDTNLSVTTSIYEGFGKAHKFEPSPIQQELVKQGKLGKKSGSGFYAYETASKG